MPRFLILGLMLATACTSESDKVAIEGGLYSTQNEEGTFSIMKVLKVDDGGVHVRLYSNTFAARPTAVAESTLYWLASSEDQTKASASATCPCPKAPLLAGVRRISRPPS